jgi:hypothetical protein
MNTNFKLLNDITLKEIKEDFMDLYKREFNDNAKIERVIRLKDSVIEYRQVYHNFKFKAVRITKMRHKIIMSDKSSYMIVYDHRHYSSKSGIENERSIYIS